MAYKKAKVFTHFESLKIPSGYYHKSEFDDSKTVVGATEEAQKTRLLQRCYHGVIVRRGVRGEDRQAHDRVNHGNITSNSKQDLRTSRAQSALQQSVSALVGTLPTHSRTKREEHQRRRTFMLARRWRRPRFTVSELRLSQVKLRWF